MNQLKKTLAMLLVFALAITGINVGITRADAENPLTVYGDAVTAAPGKEVKIPIKVRDNHGVAGLALKVTYDTAVMTPMKAEKGSILSGLANLQFGDTIANHKENSFECVAYNDSNFSDNGELLVLTFQTAANAAAGSYALKLELTEHYNEALADVEAGCEDITVSVGGDGPTGTPNVSAKPSAPTQKPNSANNFDVFIGYANKEANELVLLDDDYSIKVSRNGTHKISYKAKKTAKDILFLSLDTRLTTIPDGFSITPKTLAVGKASYPLGKCDVTRDKSKNLGISIRNAYLKGNDNAPVNQALGNKVIPVKAGDAITVAFEVSGIEDLDMSKNPRASAVKKPTSTPTKKPSSGSTSATKKSVFLAKAKTFTYGDFKYKVTDLVKENAPVKVAVIGLSKTGKKKTCINVKNAFSYAGNSCKVIQIAGSKAFKNSPKLKKAVLGSNIKCIPANAFSGCKKLSNISAAGITKISQNAFKNCKALKKLILRKKVSVKKGAFKGCKNTIIVTGGTKKINRENVKRLKKSGYNKFK